MSEFKARVRFIEQAIVAQEEERARIARELHDGIGQSLTSLLVGIRSLESSVTGNADAEYLAAQLRETAGNAIDEVRRLAQGLRPSALDDLGLGPAIERLIEEFGAHHRLAIDLEISGIGEDPRLPPSIEITLYRIVQEALNNVVKHANARRASVVLERREELVRLIVEDDGDGMSEIEESGGYGLQGIRERLALVKGELTIESSQGEGMTLFANIPCRPRAPRRFSLHFGGHDVPLGPGEYTIGRSSECEIQFDGWRISRRHARLLVGEHEVYIEDLKSTNGVFVNGRRVDDETRLRDGDGIMIGDEQVLVHSVLRRASAAPWGAERTLAGRGERTAKRAADVTERANMLEIAGTVASKWLDEGRVADAERVLSGHLRQVIETARMGDPVPAQAAASAVGCALRLAEVGKNTGWVRYALELSERTALVPSVAASEAIERLSNCGVEVPVDALRSLLDSLERQGPRLGEHRFVLDRLRKLADGSVPDSNVTGSNMSKA